MAEIEDLPPEILDMILFYLDTGPPRSSHIIDRYPDLLADFTEQPVEDFVRFDLKNASLVNHKWRAWVIPKLFRHMQWIVRRPLSALEDGGSKNKALDNGQDTKLHLETALLEFLWRTDIFSHRHVVESLTVFTIQSFWNQDFVPTQRVLRYYRRIWRRIFAVIDPLRITFMGDPHLFVVIIGDARVNGAFEWTHRPWKQILQLSRQSRNLPAHASGDIFSIRQWTNFLLNEGSFLETYDHTSQGLAPSLMKNIWGPNGRAANSKRPCLRHLQSFSYMSIGLTERQFVETLDKLFPGAENLFVRLVPRTVLSGNLLSANPDDIKWNELWWAYTGLWRSLVLKNPTFAQRWGVVRRFEATRGAYEIFNEAMDKLETQLDPVPLEGPNWRRWRRLENSCVLVRHD